MARIRAIKPQFFRHETLFEAEQESKLPLRLAFAGLWTAADREGRFHWRPRELKLDCLPYDHVDFGKVLSGLQKHGFIIRYEIDGEVFGFIPNWKKHQHINAHEAASDLPEPNEDHVVDADACTEMHVHARGEGKGREGKGMDVSSPADAGRRRTSEEFEDFLKTYPKRQGSLGKQEALKVYMAALTKGATPEEIREGARRFGQQEHANIGTPYIPQAQKWLRREGWRDFEAPSGAGPPNTGWQPGKPTDAELRAKYAASTSPTESRSTAPLVEASHRTGRAQPDMVLDRTGQRGIQSLGQALRGNGLVAKLLSERGEDHDAMSVAGMDGGDADADARPEAEI